MPLFAPSTYQTFLRRMAARIVARSAMTDLEVGGDLYTLLAAFAREMDDVSFQMSNLQSLWDLEEASGEDLDARAADFYPDEVVRLGMLTASGQVTFGRTGIVGVATIPAGHTVRVSGGPEFTTDALVSILAGFTTSAAVGITAVVGGDDGNVDAAAIAQMNAVAGVETVTNAAPTSGGQDEETDDQFRARIRAYIRSLGRGTVESLRFAALSASLTAFGRVISAEVVEDPAVAGTVRVYADDGAGTISVTDTLTANEVVLAAAAGGEVRLLTDNRPIVQGLAFNLEINAIAVVENVGYTLNRATGQITLDPTVYPTGLAPGANVQITAYTWYGGLIAEAQRIIDGDLSDVINYPGYRAAGTLVYVLPPTVLHIAIQGTLSVEDGFVSAAVIVQARNALLRYVNGLGINGDVIYNEVIHQIMAVPGVFDVALTSPVGDIVVGDAEVIRISSSDVDLT